MYCIPHVKGGPPISDNMIDLLLAHGADVNAIEPTRGQTPLIYQLQSIAVSHSLAEQ